MNPLNFMALRVLVWVTAASNEVQLDNMIVKNLLKTLLVNWSVLLEWPYDDTMLLVVNEMLELFENLARSNNIRNQLFTTTELWKNVLMVKIDC